MSKPRHLLEHKELENAITSEDLLGKDVIDSTGAFLGVTNKAYIDPKTLCVLGVAVDQGFLDRGLVIGADFVERVTEHALFLNIRPAFQLKGMSVYDVHGDIIGTVKNIHLEGDKNEIREIVIRKVRKRGLLTIPRKWILRIDEHVFLSKTIEEISRSTDE